MSNLIGEWTIEEIGKRVMGLLREYSSAINKVYNDEGTIKISMPLEIKFEQQKNRITVGIKFVTDKVEDQSIGWTNEVQGDLFKDKKHEPEEKGAPCGPGLLNEPQRLLEGPVVDAEFAEESELEEEPDGEATEVPAGETAPLPTFRIRDIETGELWEGQARTAEEACNKAWEEAKDGSTAQWNVAGCEIKIKSHAGSGGWKKYKGPSPAQEKAA